MASWIDDVITYMNTSDTYNLREVPQPNYLFEHSQILFPRKIKYMYCR